MKCPIKVTLITLSCISQFVFADYKQDWNYSNFYEEYSSCKSEMIHSAFQEYEERGMQNNMPKNILRQEIISMSPVFEEMTSSICFCVLNEVAKEQLYETYKNQRTILSAYLTASKECSDKLKNVPTLLKENKYRILKR